MRAKIKANYHWLIAAIALLVMFVCGGIGNSLNGVILIPVTESLEITRGEYSRAMIATSISGVVLNLFSGTLLLKFGYRKLIIGALVVAAGGALLASASQTLPVLCVAGVLNGMYALCSGAGNTRLLGSWFHRHYGLITGIVTAMTGLGGSAFSLIFADVVSGYGWRGAYLLTAAAYIIVALLIIFLVRNKPRDIGLKPYGEGYMPKNNKRDSEDHWEGFSFEHLRKRPSFYLMIVATFFSSACAYMALSVVNAHVQDCGLGADFGAKIQSVVMLGLAITKLGTGFLSDKLGVKKTTLIAMAALGVSMLLLAGIKDRSSAYVAAMVYSIGLPICGIIPTLQVPSLFGYRAGVKLVGIVLAMISVASMTAVPLTNTLRDMFGSYSPVFVGTAVATVFVVVLYLVLFAQTDKDRKKFENMQKEQMQGR